MATLTEMVELTGAYKEAAQARLATLDQIRLLKAQKTALVAAIGELDEQITALRIEAQATKVATKAAIVAKHQAILDALQASEGEAANP